MGQARGYDSRRLAGAARRKVLSTTGLAGQIRIGRCAGLCFKASSHRRNRPRQRTDPPKVRPLRLDQRIHASRLTHRRPAGHQPNPIFERDRIGRRLQMSAAWWWARAWPCSRSAPTGPSLVVCVLPAVALALDAPAWLLAALRAQSSRTPRLPVRPDVRPAWIRQPATGASVPVRVPDVCPR